MGELHKFPGMSSNLTPAELAFKREYESVWREVVEMLTHRGLTDVAIYALIGVCVSNAICVCKQNGGKMGDDMLENLREFRDGASERMN